MSWSALLSGLGRALWLSAPFCAALLLTLITAAPFHAFGDAVPAPNFAVIAVFFWAVYAPQFLPPAGVFVLGLTMDLLGAGPIGFWPLLLLGVYGATLSQRHFFLGRSVFGVWAGFAAIAILATAVGWIVVSLYYGHWSDATRAFGQTLVSILVFPVVGRIFFGLRRMMTAAPERTYS
jgi:rod shape-determining protein MreD